MRTHSIANNIITIEQLLEFEVLFPDEKPLKPEEYLNGGSKNVILNIAAHFLGFKVHDSKFNNIKALSEAIFSNENKEFANYVYNKIETIKKMR